jgi:hypothetical protein
MCNQLAFWQLASFQTVVVQYHLTKPSLLEPATPIHIYYYIHAFATVSAAIPDHFVSITIASETRNKLALCDIILLSQPSRSNCGYGGVQLVAFISRNLLALVPLCMRVSAVIQANGMPVCPTAHSMLAMLSSILGQVRHTVDVMDEP